MADSYIIEILLTARDEASQKIRALQAQIDGMKAKAAGSAATNDLSKGLDDTAAAADRAATQHERLNRNQDQTRRVSQQTASEVRKVGTAHDSAASSVSGHADGTDALAKSASAATPEVKKLADAARDTSGALTRASEDSKSTSRDTRDLTNEVDRLSRSYGVFNEQASKMPLDEQRRGFAQFATELKGLTRQLDIGGASWRNLGQLADDAKRKASASGVAEEGDRVAAAYRKFDTAVQSGSVSVKEARRGYADLSGELRGVGRAFSAGSDEAQRFLGMADRAGKQSSQAASEASSGWQSLAHRFDDVGVKIVSLSAQLRGLVLALGAGLVQQLDTSIVGLAGALFSLASAAGQAAAALGGALVAAIAQTIPTAAIAIDALSRLKLVFQAVSAANQAQQQSGQTGRQQQLQNLSATNAVISAQQNLANSSIAVANAQKQLTTAQSQLTIARRDAARQITDLMLAEQAAELQAKGAAITTEEAQQNLARVVQTGGTGTTLESAQLQVQQAQLGQNQANVALPRARFDAALAQRQGVGGNPSVIAASQAVTQAQQGVVQAQQSAGNAARALAQAELSAKNTSQQLTAVQSQLAALLAKLSPVEKQLFNVLDRLSKYFQSPSSPFNKIADNILSPFVNGFSRLLTLLNDPKFLAPFDKLSKAMGGGVQRIFDQLLGPQGANFLDDMAKKAAQNVPILVDSLVKLMNVFEDVARAAAPALHMFIVDFNNFITALSQKWSTPQGFNSLTNFFTTGATYAEKFAHWIEALGRLLGALAKDAAPQGAKALGGWTDGLNRMTAWVNSHGPEVTKFFHDSMMVLQTILSLIGHFGLAMLHAFDPGSMKAFTTFMNQIVLPGILDLVKAIGFLTEAFLNVLNFFDKLIAPFTRFLGIAHPVKDVVEALVGAFAGLLVVNKLLNMWERATIAMKALGLATATTATETEGLVAAQTSAEATGAVGLTEGAGLTAAGLAGGGVAGGAAAKGGLLSRLFGAGGAGAAGLGGAAAGLGAVGLVGGVAAIFGQLMTSLLNQAKKVNFQQFLSSGGTGGGFQQNVPGFAQAQLSSQLQPKIASGLLSQTKGLDIASQSSQSLERLRKEAEQILRLPDITATQRKGLQALISQLDPANVAVKKAGALWGATFQGINATTGNVMQQVIAVLKTDIKNISDNLGTGTNKGAQAMAATITSAYQTVLNNTSLTAKGVQSGLQSIGTMLNNALKAVGATGPGQQISLQSFSALPGNVQGGLLSGLLTAGGVASPHATGGYESARPGGKIIQVAEGGYPEVVLTTDPKYAPRQQQLLGHYLRQAPQVARGVVPQFATGGQVNAATGVGGSGSTTGGYVYPIGPGAVDARIDQGKDFTGGPFNVGAIGPGSVIRDTLWPGWPGTGGVVYRLTAGPKSGSNVYQMEHQVAKVHTGEQVTPGQIVTTSLPGYPWLEIGWANSGGTGPLTPYNGAPDGTPMPGGKDFAAFIAGLAHGKLTGGTGLAGGVSGLGAAAAKVAWKNIQAPKWSGPGGALGAIGQGILQKVTAAANKYGSSKTASSAPASGGTFSGTLNGSAEQMISQFFTAAGMNKIAIAGLIGNAVQESSLNWNTPGGGMWQQISNFGSGTGGSPQAQMSKMLSQIRGLIPQMNAAGTPGNAAVIFEQGFERAGIPAMANRIAGANAAFAAGFAKGGWIDKIKSFASGGNVSPRASAASGSGGNVWAVKVSEEASSSGGGWTELSTNGNAAAASGHAQTATGQGGWDFATLGRMYPKGTRLNISQGSRSGTWPLTDFGNGSSFAPAIGLTPAVRGVIGGASGSTVDISMADGSNINLASGFGHLVSGSGGTSTGSSSSGSSSSSTSTTPKAPVVGAIAQKAIDAVNVPLNKFLAAVTGQQSLPPAIEAINAAAAAKQAASSSSTPSSSSSSSSSSSTSPKGGGSVIQNMVSKAASIAAHHYPYTFGGGHGGGFGPTVGSNGLLGYDCSGAVSAVLNAGGLLGSPEATGGLAGWGAAGAGKNMAVYVENSSAGGGHTIMSLLGRLWGTHGGSSGGIGGEWLPGTDPNSFSPLGHWEETRHAPGLAQGGWIDALKGVPKFARERVIAGIDKVLPGLFAGGYIEAADGYSGMVSQPTLFLAGEAGTEHVGITPMATGGFTGDAKRQKTIPIPHLGPTDSLEGGTTGIVDPLAFPVNQLSGILNVFRAIADGFTSLKKISIKSDDFNKNFTPYVDSLLTQDTGVLDRLGSAFTVITSLLTAAQVIGTKAAGMGMTAAQKGYLSGYKTAFTSSGGVVRESISPGDQGAEALNAAREERTYLQGEQKIVGLALGQVQKRLRQATALAKKDPNKYAGVVTSLTAEYNNLITRMQTLTGAIADNVTAIFQAEQTRISNALTDIQTKYSIALTTSNNPATPFTAAASSIGPLKALLKRAMDIGDKQLQQSVLGAITQLFSDTASAIDSYWTTRTHGVNANDIGRQQAFAQNVLAKQAYGPSGLGGPISAAVATLNSANANQGVLQGQIYDYTALLGQANKAGDTDSIRTLTDKLKTLQESLAENTQAIKDDTSAIVAARIQQITNRGQFQGGVFSGLYGIVQTLGQISGSQNVPELATLLSGSNNVLNSTNAGLAQTLLGSTGVDLRGLTGQGLASAVSGLNFDQLEMNMSQADRTNFETLISSIVANDGAITQNNLQLAQLNGQLAAFTITTSAFAQFRQSIFSAGGSLLPQYSVGTPSVALSVPPVSSPSTMSANQTGGGDTHLHLDSPLEVADPATLAKRFAWEYSVH